MYVKTKFVDAGTGKTPIRTGPTLPHPELVVTFVDRRQMPATIYGALPDGSQVTDVIEEITQSEYDDAVLEYTTHTQTRMQAEIDAASISDSEKSNLTTQLQSAMTREAILEVRSQLRDLTVTEQ